MMQHQTARPIVGAGNVGAPVTGRTASARPKRSPNLREARFEDYPQIVSLATEYGLPPRRTLEEWQHLWVSNPAYLRLGGDWPVGWVLEAEGRIVGHMGNVPSFYELGSRQLLCASGLVYGVAAEYRGYSLLLLDSYLRQERADLVLSNAANSQSFRVHAQLGAIRVPIGVWNQSSVWITGYSELLADWLSRRNFRAAKLLSYPAALALTMKDSWNRMLLATRARRGAKLELCSGFDQRFEEFWEELRRRYPHKLLAVRSRSTLEWHFHYALRENRIWILTLSECTRLQAYAVFVLPKGKPGDPIRRMHLADFQSLDQDDGLYCAILQSALKQSRQSGVHLLSTTGFSASGTDTTTLAPYHTALPNWIFVYSSEDPHLAKALADPQVWAPSMYDATATL